MMKLNRRGTCYGCGMRRVLLIDLCRQCEQAESDEYAMHEAAQAEADAHNADPDGWHLAFMADKPEGETCHYCYWQVGD